MTIRNFTIHRIKSINQSNLNNKITNKVKQVKFSLRTQTFSIKESLTSRRVWLDNIITSGTVNTGSFALAQPPAGGMLSFLRCWISYYIIFVGARESLGTFITLTKRAWEIVWIQCLHY